MGLGGFIGNTECQKFCSCAAVRINILSNTRLFLGHMTGAGLSSLRALGIFLLQKLLCLLELALARRRQVLAAAIDEVLDHPNTRSDTLGLTLFLASVLAIV